MKIYHSICSNILFKYAQITIKLRILNFLLQQFLLRKLKFRGGILKPTAYVAHEAAADREEQRFFKHFEGKKINMLVAASNKLTNNFEGPAYKWSRAGCGPQAASWTTMPYL
jgi:hypothetical protein